MTVGTTDIVATPDGVASRLPLFGRERDIAAVIGLLSASTVRLVTLTGPGGVGKTRLAMQVARDAGALFADGVHVIPLAAIRNVRRLPSAILLALQTPETGAASDVDAIADVIGDRRALFVLDNMEQIIEASVYLSGLLVACPQLKLLVTSRMPLRLSSEFEYAVASLAAPNATASVDPADIAGSPAVQLFLQRARSTRAEFDLTPANAEAIAEITRRLDGLPLAIELAAARTKILSPQALLTRLTQSLQVLTGGPRDAPARLQSMRDAIDWSYELLDEDLQAFFRSLGVFVGGFTLEAVEAVAGSTASGGALEHVSTLVDHSLVTPIQEDIDEPRFGLLETIREYALEALVAAGERDEVRRRHADWVSVAMSAASARFFGPREIDAMWEIERNTGNLRVALVWLIEHDPERAAGLAYDSWYFWGVRGHYREGLEWALRVDAQRARLSPSAAARVDLIAGFLHWALGEYEPATARFTDALATFSDIRDPRGAATSHFGRGSILRDQDRSDEAEIELQSALRAFEELDDPAWIAFCLSVLGAVSRQTGRYDEAILRLERALAITRALEYPGGMSPLVDHLGDIARARGEFMRALDYYRQALPYWVEQHDPHGAADSLAGFAAALEGIGDFESATTLISAAAATYDRLGFPRSRHSKALNDQTLDSLRRALSDQQFQACWDEGQAMPLDLALKTASAYEPRITEIGPVPPPVLTTRFAAFGLTPREIEILDQLIVGRSNHEIGDALSISPRTVGTHVANIYGKLGVSTRSAAVATVMRARAAVAPS